jgi:serine/threonine protein kinase
MTPERWQQVEEVLQEALDLPRRERASFLDAVCGDDEDLKHEAGSLITAHDNAGDFIEEPAMAQDAHVFLSDSVRHDIGPYKIIQSLGSGGMGDVFLAHDSRLNRAVALKILPPYLAADDVRLHRFQREARAASALNHPNILTIHEVGEHEGIRFIATEFIDGQTLRGLIGDLSIEEILDIAIQIASALSAAHSAGIVHRDIKPENIMRRADGLVKILDFGIAKLIDQDTAQHHRDKWSDARIQTEIGVVMGTVNYMSPEQARAVEVDQRTDIWSLGVLLFEMLTNRLPFNRATRMDTLVSILEREPGCLNLDTDVPELQSLERIVSRTLRKHRSERYQTADDLLVDLKRLRTSLGREGPARSSNAGSIAAQPRRVMVLAGFGVVLALIAGAFLYRQQVHIKQGSTVNVSLADTTKPYLLMSEAEKLSFINEQEQRVSAMMGDRPAKLDEEALHAIRTHVEAYVSRPDDVDGVSLKAIFSRAKTHVPLISRSFAARKVPVIIGIYLPVVESDYRSCFENDAGAKGLFQFLPGTARNYGVAHEEMCDVEKMAPAAAHYIADRMAELGEDSQSLTLVLLSYNRGPEGVRDALRELRDTENYQRNFWTLFANRDKLGPRFSKENAGYVPAFFAAAIIGENPRAFALPGPPLSTLASQ